MSTLSYFRHALIRAEKRLAKYEARRAGFAARLGGPEHASNAKALSNLEADPSYQAAKAAVANLASALTREEGRLYADPGARL